MISFQGRGGLTITALTFLKLLLTMRRKLPVSENTLLFFHCSSFFLILMVVNFDLCTVLGKELSIVQYIIYCICISTRAFIFTTRNTILHIHTYIHTYKALRILLWRLWRLFRRRNYSMLLFSMKCFTIRTTGWCNQLYLYVCMYDCVCTYYIY